MAVTSINSVLFPTSASAGTETFLTLQCSPRELLIATGKNLALPTLRPTHIIKTKSIGNTNRLLITAKRAQMTLRL